MRSEGEERGYRDVNVSANLHSAPWYPSQGRGESSHVSAIVL